MKNEKVKNYKVKIKKYDYLKYSEKLSGKY